MITYDFENSCIRVDGEITFSRDSNAEFFFWYEEDKKCSEDPYEYTYPESCDAISLIEEDRLVGDKTILRVYPMKNGHINDHLIFIEFVVLNQVTATEFELKPCD